MSDKNDDTLHAASEQARQVCSALDTVELNAGRIRAAAGADGRQADVLLAGCIASCSADARRALSALFASMLADAGVLAAALDAAVYDKDEIRVYTPFDRLTQMLQLGCKLFDGE